MRKNAEAIDAYYQGTWDRLHQLGIDSVSERKEDRIKMFDKVMGTDRIRKALIQNIPVKEIEDSWQKNLDEFKQIREKYLIYKL